MALQGHPRSFILAPIESAYATSFNSNFGPVGFMLPFVKYNFNKNNFIVRALYSYI